MAELQAPARYLLRRVLRAVLPTDSDFTAFCVKFFPEAAHRFADSMDRVQKASLLLELSDASKLLEALRQQNALCVAQFERQLRPPGAPTQNPYRGLASFQHAEAYLFFGREALTAEIFQRFEELWEKPGATRLLAVLGPSGSGKSSVARAGLLAALTQSPVPGPEPLRFAIVKPGERPIESLARALLPLLPNDPADLAANRQLAIERLFADTHEQGLRRFAADLPQIERSPLVVLVDQFEELYTLCKEPSTRDQFVATLLHAASDSGRSVSVVLTLRTDFIGETQRQHEQLNRLLGSQSVLVTAMSPDELRDAIAKPAEQEGRALDEATISLLLEETHGNQGALPLLEFALTRIWEGMERDEEPSATLRKIGGVGGALAGEAQKIYGRLLDAEKATARRALVRLVRLGEGTRDTRRRTPVAELCGRGEDVDTVLAVLRKFAGEQSRLVTLGGEPAEPVAEVTHESLFEHWKELGTWIEQSRQDRGLHDRALDAAKLWDKDARPPGRLWLPPDLDLLRGYQSRKPDEIGPLLTSFLGAAERRQRRERVVRLGSVFTVVATLLIAAGVYVVKERQRAKQTKELLLESFVDRGRRLLFEAGRANEGLLWLHRAQGEGSRDPALPDLLKSGMESLDASTAVLIGHKGPLVSAKYSPNGDRIVTASLDKTARIWDAKTGLLEKELKGHQGNVLSADFSPNGRYVVTASADSRARVWAVDTGKIVAEFTGHGGVVLSAHYNPDSPEGFYVLTASDDKTAQVWESGSGRVVATLTGHTDRVVTANYSSNGRRVVTASDDKTARVWDAKTGRLVAILEGHEERVKSAEFSPDDKRVVTASNDKTARVWDAETGRLRIVINGHGSDLNSATYSPDGNRVLTASDDGTARVWEEDSAQLVTELKGHGSNVISARYSHDGLYIVTASHDKTARVWNAETGNLVAEFKGHGSGVNSASFSPDGRHVVTASDDSMARVWERDSRRLLGKFDVDGYTLRSNRLSPGCRQVVTVYGHKITRVLDTETGRVRTALTGYGEPSGLASASFSPNGGQVVTANWNETARVWDAQTGIEKFPLKGHTASVNSASYSPDGRYVVTASEDKTAQVWDAATGQLANRLIGHQSAVNVAQFSPNGRRVVTVGSDKVARVWNADSGRPVSVLQDEYSTVDIARYSSDGRRIVTTNFSDGAARLWDAESGRLVAVFKGDGSRIVCVDYSPDGRRVVTASETGSLRVWDATPETRSYEELAKIIRCNVPAQFERPDSSIISFRMPTPQECQATGGHPAASQPTPK